MSSDSRPWRIAVTGLSGFVGSYFKQHVEALGRSDLEVVSLFGQGGLSHDIRDAQSVTEAMAAVAPDVVLHLAAMALPASARADPAAAWGVNVIGTLNIVQAIRALSRPARLIFVGSSEAYGASFLDSSDPLRESAALVPRSAYGATKAAADLMVGQLGLDGLHAVRFRPFNHTGPGQAADYVIPSFARQVARIEQGLQPPVVKVGNLDAERDFLDVRDVVAAYALAAMPEADLPTGAVMNLSTGAPLPIRTILSMMLDRAKLPISVAIDEARMRPNDIARASGSPSQAKALLSWTPTIPFQQTVTEVLDSWRALGPAS